MIATNDNYTVIIGAGWAGLSAACYLSQKNHLVSLYESSRHPGGRARSVELGNHNRFYVDNGQHLLIGAYHNTLKLLRLISVDINKSFTRKKLKLSMYNLKDEKLLLKTFNLPAPFNLFFGLLFCQDLSVTQKYRVMVFSLKLSRNKLLNSDDISVKKLLLQNNQPKKLINALWEPLCIATLNTPIEKASARIFITVLQKSLLGNSHDSDFLFTRQNLSSILPHPAIQYLKNNNASIKMSSRASEIIIQNNSVIGIVINDEFIATNSLILAIPPYACIKLLSKHKQLNDITNKLLEINYQPICTIYLQYAKEVSLNQEMIGIWGSTIQWLFDRKTANQEGLMAAVISAHGEHMKLDNDELIQKVISEIQSLYPHWPSPLSSNIIREKRATFSCDVNISNKRPINKTPVKGLWLCGDYTETNLPATIEGAIISANLTATEIIKEKR